MRRLVITLSVPIVVIDASINDGMEGSLRLPNAHRSSVGGEMSLSELRSFLVRFPSNSQSVHETLEAYRNNSVMRECVDPSSAFCYTFLMSYVYLSSNWLNRGGTLRDDPGPICAILRDSGIRDRIKHSMRILATEREFNIPSYKQFSLVALPQLCDIAEDKELRMAVFFQRIYEHATKSRSVKPQKIIAVDHLGFFGEPQVVFVSGEDLFNKVLVLSHERRSYHYWRIWVTRGRIEGYLKKDVSSTSPERIRSAYELGKFMALALLEQASLGARLPIEVCETLVNGVNPSWTMEDLAENDSALYNEYQDFENSVFRGDERFFVSLIDPTRELVPNGKSILVTVENLSEWSSLAFAETAALYYGNVLDGFTEMFPRHIFADHVISPHDLCYFMEEGRGPISTSELMAEFHFPDDMRPDVKQWLADIFEEGTETYRRYFSKLMRSLYPGPFPPLTKLIQTCELQHDVAAYDAKKMVLSISCRINSRIELSTALRGIERSSGDRGYPPMYRRLDHARQRIIRESAARRNDRIMWEVSTEDSLADTLSRVALANPIHLLNKIHIQYRDGGHVVFGDKAYTEWLSGLFTPIFTNGMLFDLEGGEISMTAGGSNDPSLTAHYRAVGRLLALSFKDEVPTGYALPIVLVNRIFDRDRRPGLSSHNIRGVENLLRDKYPEVYIRFTKILRAVIKEEAAMDFVSLTGEPILEHYKLDRSNLDEWRRLVSIEYMYSQNKMGIDALVNGFNEILPWASQMELSDDEFVEIFRGTKNGGLDFAHYSCKSLREHLLRVPPETRATFHVILTGMTAVPIRWNKTYFSCTEGSGFGINVADARIATPTDWTNFVNDVNMLDSTTPAEVWDRLRDAADLFLRHSNNIHRESEIRRNLYSRDTRSDTGNYDVYSWWNIARVVRLNVGAVMSLEEFGGLELVSRIIAKHDADSMVALTFLLGELVAQPDEIIHPSIWEFIRREICPILVVSQEDLKNVLNPHISYPIRVLGGFLGSEISHPLAKLPAVCPSIPLSITLRKTVLEHRIGRNDRSDHPRRPAPVRIPHDFDVVNVLDIVAGMSTAEFAVLINNVFDEAGPVNGGGRPYTRWLSRTFDKLLPLYFVPDQSGINRLKRDSPSPPTPRDYSFGGLLDSIGIYRPSHENPMILITSRLRLRAIGRLFASSITSSIPFRAPLNYGFYKFLIEGPNYEWVGEDLRIDDPVAYESWNEAIESYLNGEDLGMSYISLDDNDVLIPNGRGVHLGRMNIEAWATAALTHHMYGRYKSAYDAIRIGFGEVLRSDPSDIFKDVMGVEELRSTIEGAREVSTDQLMAGIFFQDFSRTEQVLVRSWLVQLFDEGGNQFRMNFLNFATGWKSMPINGFNYHTHIRVTRVNRGNTDALPESDTRIHQISLQLYPTIEIMKASLELAVAETQVVSH
jgi:hypothetical protein